MPIDSPCEKVYTGSQRGLKACSTKRDTFLFVEPASPLKQLRASSAVKTGHESTFSSYVVPGENNSRSRPSNRAHNLSVRPCPTIHQQSNYPSPLTTMLSRERRKDVIDKPLYNDPSSDVNRSPIQGMFSPVRSSLGLSESSFDVDSPASCDPSPLMLPKRMAQPFQVLADNNITQATPEWNRAESSNARRDLYKPPEKHLDAFSLEVDPAETRDVIEPVDWNVEPLKTTSRAPDTLKCFEDEAPSFELMLSINQDDVRFLVLICN